MFARTMQGFSTNTDIYTYGYSGNYHLDFQKYVGYYGSSDFADKIIMGSLLNKTVSLRNGNWALDLFSFRSQAAFARVASANLLFPLVVASKLEKAVEKCFYCIGRNGEALGYLDEAVAYYTGSSEGTDGVGRGYLQYGLNSQFNNWFATEDFHSRFFHLFTDMQAYLLNGKCPEAADTKQIIFSKSFVGLFQGALFNAWRSGIDNGSQVVEAEGAAFAAGVLPLIAACNKADADLIFQSMKPAGQTNTVNFLAVKAALEKNYACLGLECSDIGGLYDYDEGVYIFEPCGDATVTDAPTEPVTNAPMTTAPMTTAPMTTAPVTTAPVTTAPVTTAPMTTAPITVAPVTATPATAALVLSPVAAPTGSPMSAPAAAPVSSPVAAPTGGPVTAPNAAPLAAPVSSPVVATIFFSSQN